MALFELKQNTGSEAAAPWAPPTFKGCVAADIDAAFEAIHRAYPDSFIAYTLV